MDWMIGYYGAVAAAGVMALIAAWQAWRAHRERVRREDEIFKLQAGTLNGLRREQTLEDRIDELEREIRRRDSRIHHIAETRKADIEAARKAGREDGLREANLIRIEQAWEEKKRRIGA